MNLLADLFINPMRLPFDALWMIIPVSLGVAIVYKTLRTNNIRRLALQSAGLTLYILGGITALMVGFWVLLHYWPHH